MKTGIIYGLVCPKEKIIKYVGQTVRSISSRKNGHVADLNVKVKRGCVLNKKEEWLLTLKTEGLINFLEVIQLEECSLDLLNEREKFWISLFKPQILNILSGGCGFTEEDRVKLSESKKGEKNPMFGKTFTMSEEHKKKISEALLKSDKLKASHNTKEFKQKISEKQSQPLLILDEDFNVVMEFANSTTCAEYFGFTRGNIKNACRFLRSIGKGKDFKYWVVRKHLKEDSIKKLKEKQMYGTKVV